MAKPPKKVTSTHAADSSSTPPRTSSREDVLRGDQPVQPGVRLPTGEPEPDSRISTNPTRDTPHHHQPVVVTEMPGGETITRLANLVSWPRDQIDQLIRIGDSGLFMSKAQKMYADVENAGLGRVELNSKGDYQVHFPFAPDYPGPVLKKIAGKAQWQFIEPWAAPQAGGSNTNIPATDAPVIFINPAAVKKLPAANELGIRWHNLRSYVDLINEGTVLVGKGANGDYQATIPQEWTPSGPAVERIGVTRFWRRKSTSSSSVEKLNISEHSSSSEDSGPGPAKRYRTDESRDKSANISITSDFNPYLWASWGTIAKPETVESVQIGQLHYQIVPHGQLPYPLVTYLQHPDFPPSRFEVFEKMLAESPGLQPVAAIRNSTSSPWNVQGNARQFDRPITQTVMDSFQDFSVYTARAIAKRLFEHSSRSEIILQDGLSVTAVTLRHWKDKSPLFVPEFENPVDLLPVASRTGPSESFISTRPPTPRDPLQRLDFTLQRYQVEWTRYMEQQSYYNLKHLMNTLLSNNGYEVFPFIDTPWNPALIFRRANHDKIYFLKLGLAEGDYIELKATPPELSDPTLANNIGNNAYQALMTANEQNNIVWLAGGAQTTASGWQSAFIMRER